MGFNLGIGEFCVDVFPEERDARLSVENVASDDAPGFSCESHRNWIYPSYSAWAEFARRTGLDDVFYGPGKLLDMHPGTVELTQEHLDAFQAARDAYCTSHQDIVDGVDYNVRRLDWLVWWTKWALEHCKYPTFANS